MMIVKKIAIAVQASALAFALATGALAQGKSTTNQGSTPNGKPFTEIQAQLAQVNQQIQALQTQIASVESGLQAQINSIYASIAGLQTQINTVQDATAALQAQVTANESAIAALQAAVASLQSELSAAQALIAGNTGDIQALQVQVSSLQTLIGAHQSQIASLQQQNAQTNQFLANLASGTCQTGQAISDIGPNGIIQCSQAGGAGNLVSLTQYAYYPLQNGFNSASLSCPAGYTLTGGGYSAPSYYESYQYVYYVGYQFNYWWNGGFYDYYTVPYSYYGYRNFSPVSVTASYPWTGSSSYQVQIQYLPQNYYSGYSFYVYANCVKVQ